MGFTINFQLQASLKWDDAAKVWVSHCPNLRLFSQGTTKIEAEDSLKDAARLFIKSCIDRGILEETLKDLGFEQADAPVSGPMDLISLEEEKAEMVSMDVPIYLLGRQEECRQPLAR